MFKNHMHGPLVTYKRWQPGAPLPRLPTDGGAVFGISNIPDENMIPSDESITRIHKTKHVKNQNYHDPAENGFKGMASLFLKIKKARQRHRAQVAIKEK